VLAQADVILLVAAPSVLEALVARLEARAGTTLVTATDAEQALASIDEQAADVLLVDLESLGDSAYELLAAARSRWPDLPLLASAKASGSDAWIRALGGGASDVVAAGAPDLVFAIDKALVRARRATHLPPPQLLGSLVFGRSPAMRAVAEQLAQVAPASATVLVRGESGTGKELVARELHRMSPLRERAFIKIDCASLPDTLLESELFGYEKGAFTGATARKLGRVELAEGGTLFLDEIGELSASTQAKLLRLLQDREFERLGGTTTLRVDVRIIAATHRDLETMVERRQFRQDLFYRLNVVPIWLPPLRARRADIEELARHFCAHASARNQREGVTLEPEAIRVLAAQRWPGNVRQLANFVERLVVLCRSASIDEALVRAELARPLQFATETGSTEPPAEVGGASSAHLSQVVRDAERHALLRALDQAGGNRSVAARLLGVSRSTFYAKLRDYGILEP